MAPIAPTSQPAAPAASDRRRRKRTLVLVFDGLRSADLRNGSMPNLQRFVSQGTNYVKSRTGFPSETMVGAGELFSGAYPERSGITANNMVVPGSQSTGVEIKGLENLRKVEAAYGDTIPVQTMFDAMRGAGLRTAWVGKAGPAEMAGMNGANVAVSTEGGLEDTGNDIHAEVTKKIGPAPDRGKKSSDGARSEWLRKAAQYINATRRPDLLGVWFTDPDSTQHMEGLDSKLAKDALRRVDAEAGAMLDALAASGELANTNVVITSDHGFSQHANHNELDLKGELNKAGLRPTHVIGSGNQHLIRFKRQPTPNQLRRLKQAIADAPFADQVRAVVVNPHKRDRDARGNRRLTGLDLMNGRARAGDVYVFYQRTGTKHVNPRPSVTVAGHGSLGWSDLNHTLAVVGPDFEQGVVTRNPAGIVDVAPTILQLNGIPIPRSMQGRVLRESFRDGIPGVDSVRQRQNVATSQARVGNRMLTARLHTTHVGSTQYFDGFSTDE